MSRYWCNDHTRYLQSSKGLQIFYCAPERFSWKTFRIGRVLRPTFKIAESFQVSLNDDTKKNMQINNFINIIVSRSSGFIAFFPWWTIKCLPAHDWNSRVRKLRINLHGINYLPLLCNHCQLGQRRHDLPSTSNTARNLMSTTLDATF
jgi:hypothetical protein